MLPTLVHTVLFVALAIRHVAASMQIDTPTLTQCQDATINYSGGSGEYGLYIVPSVDPCADSIVNIPLQSATSYTWKVDIPAGSKVEFLVEDATGDEAWSGIATVQSSNDASCIDPKAVQALNAAQGAPANASSISSAGSSDTPSVPTTVALPSVSAGYASGVPKAVSPSGVANAAGGTSAPSTSGAIPHAALRAGSFLGVTALALLLTIIHL